MLASWWKWIRGRGVAPTERRHPEPQLPSDSLYDELRHEAAAQRQAGMAPPAGKPAPLSRTLEKVIAATTKR